MAIISPSYGSHCVWLYHRFPLSFREVEEMMMARGVVVTYETAPDQWMAALSRIPLLHQPGDG